MKKEVRRNAIKEYQRIEEMFPVNHLLISRNQMQACRSSVNFGDLKKDIMKSFQAGLKAKESLKKLPRMNFIEDSKYRGFRRTRGTTQDIPEASPQSELSTPATMDLEPNNLDNSNFSLDGPKK